MAIGSDAGPIFKVLSDAREVSLELQVAVSLRRLWQHRGKRAAAHQRLAAALEAQVGGNVAGSD
jgi:hypothetical protein